MNGANASQGGKRSSVYVLYTQLVFNAAFESCQDDQAKRFEPREA